MALIKDIQERIPPVVLDDAFSANWQNSPKVPTAGRVYDKISTLAFTDISGVVSINKGGSGQTTANAALNAFLPAQSGNSGKSLFTDGSNTSWINPLTSGRVVVGGGAHRLLYEDASQNLAASANAVFNGTKLSANQLAVLSSTSHFTNGFNNGVDLVHNGGGIFRMTESAEYGAFPDVFMQLIPGNPGALGVIESYLAAAIAVGTQNSANPVLLAPGRSLSLIRGTSGGLLLATGGSPGALSRVAARALEIEGNFGDWHMRLGNGQGSSSFTYDMGRNYGSGYLHFHGNQSGAYGFIFSGADGELGRFSPNGLELPNGKNLVAGTATGSKFGTSALQKLGWWNATPVVQGAAIADITDSTGGTIGSAVLVSPGIESIDLGSLNDSLATITARINAILNRMRTPGWIAT